MDQTEPKKHNYKKQDPVFVQMPDQKWVAGYISDFAKYTFDTEADDGNDERTIYKLIVVHLIESTYYDKGYFAITVTADNLKLAPDNNIYTEQSDQESPPEDE